MKKRITIKLIVRDFLLNALLAVGGEMVLRYLLPKYWIPYYPFIPLFFFIMGVVIFFTLHHYVQIKGNEHIVTTYLSVRFYKMIMTLILIWLYAANIHQKMFVFAICVMVIYVVNLIYETSVMTNYVKKGMKKDETLQTNN